jgi:biofilm PGA synthesis protein PgaD
MGKSGSGYTMIRAHSPFIISYPEHQSGSQRVIFGALTVIIWALWLSLWQPLITAMLWIVGVRWGYIQVFNGARGVSLWLILWGLLLVTVVVVAWSTFNNLRYASKTQRRKTQSVSKTAIRERFGITDPMLFLLLHERRLSLYFDDSGQLIRVDVLAETPAHQPSLYSVAT